MFICSKCQSGVFTDGGIKAEPSNQLRMALHHASDALLPSPRLQAATVQDPGQFFGQTFSAMGLITRCFLPSRQPGPHTAHQLTTKPAANTAASTIKQQQHLLQQNLQPRRQQQPVAHQHAQLEVQRTQSGPGLALAPSSTHSPLPSTLGMEQVHGPDGVPKYRVYWERSWAHGHHGQQSGCRAQRDTQCTAVAQCNAGAQEFDGDAAAVVALLPMRWGCCDIITVLQRDTAHLLTDHRTPECHGIWINVNARDIGFPAMCRAFGGPVSCIFASFSLRLAAPPGMYRQVEASCGALPAAQHLQ